ncbi:restriction endonuclease subunit S [Stutzerimonas balearica]|uniref:restriction endonuclease subunit S n=1 Tax=Stutzerimonas balearica TaxID=74829 RepID=UPI003F774014
MSSEWAYAKLGDLTINLDTKRKPVKEADRKAGPYPYYGASGVVDYVDGYIFDGEHLLIAEDGENLRTRQTPIAFRACGKFWVNNHAHIVVGNDRASTRYLEYAVLGSDITSYLTGAVMPKLTQGNLNRIEVPCPPRAVQDAIVAVLGSLDDRITLLRETNATLEAIAQALFKSWFVDFDPVHAKAEGRQPEGMDTATAALFPGSFEESELGLVPKGWGIKSVAEVAEVVKGKSYTSKELADTHDTALVTLKSFARGGGFRLDGFKPYTGSYKPAQVVVPGDLIIAYTDVTQAAELIGKPAIVIGVEDYQTLVASLDVGIVRPDTQKVSRQYLYGLFRTDSFQSHTFAHTSGTTVLHLAKDGVGSYQFSCPPSEIIQSFSVITDALSQRCQNNIDQVRNLTQLRDTLLPRLISGQLRLPEAEALLENSL